MTDEAPAPGSGEQEPAPTAGPAAHQPPAPRMPPVPPSGAAPIFGAPGAAGGFDPSRPVFLKPGQQPPLGGPMPTSWQPAGGSDGFGFPAEDPVRPWPWWISFVGLAAAFLSILAAGVVLGVIVAVASGSTDNIQDYDYIFGIVQDVLWVGVAIAVPLAIARWITPEHLGLRRRKPGWTALKGVIVLFSFYLLAAIYAAALGLDDNSNQLLQDTGFGKSLSKDLVYAILYPVAAPVAEELLFRGIVFKGLRDGFRSRFSRPVAVGLGALISGGIFGAAHLGGGQDKFIPVLIALGVLLALAYEWSGTLYVPIAIHAINNAVATGSSSDPTQDWVYGVIAAGPVIAILVAMLIARIVRRLPSEPRPTLPPSFPTTPPAWPVDGPRSDRPPGL